MKSAGLPSGTADTRERRRHALVTPDSTSQIAKQEATRGSRFAIPPRNGSKGERMGERAANPPRWWLPFCGCAGAAIVVLPSLVLGNGMETFLVTVAIGAIIGLTVFVVLFRSVRRQSTAALPVILMAAVFCAGSWLLFKSSDDVRTTGRWLLQSGRYKAAILAQPDPINRELKHAEWDGWGFAGQETTVYVVFDPNDSLRGAAESHSPGKYAGIPCEVYNVRRLENRWYRVRFYTNTDWNNCS